MISPRTLRNLRKELRRSRLAQLGIAIFVLVIFVAVFAPFLAPHDPTAQHLERTQLPPVGFSKTVTTSSPEMVNGSVEIVTKQKRVESSWRYPLGTDQLGRGVLSRVVYGTRTSLLVGLLGVAVAAVIGVPVGLTAGYLGGTADDVLMRAADVMLAFPSLVLAVALVGLFGKVTVEVPAPWVALGLAPATMPAVVTLPVTVIIVVGLVNWVWLARVARGEALTISEAEYIKAAKSVGASDTRVIARHVFPNAVTPILVLATIQVAAIILLESSLAYLGFTGTSLSWGYSISRGQQYLSSSWWIATFPGIAIVIAVVGINLIGDWLRDALDPGIEGEEGGI